MKPSQRHKARYHALQSLYQVLFTEHEADEVINQHLEEINPKKVDASYFRQLVEGVLSSLDKLDNEFKPFLSRDLSELTPIELCVLRLATYELKECLDVPYRVVINEALELNKVFGTEEGFKFVNGVLDKVAKKLRATEIKST